MPTWLKTPSSVTITYSVQYRPECETNSGQDWVVNEADWSVSSIDYQAYAYAYLVENTACQLAACKVNYDDTGGSPADCTNPVIPRLLKFSGTQTFTAFYQNLASTPTPVGRSEERR